MARTATIVRETSESKVELSLNLDGTGKTDIDTSVPFYNHMMTALGKMVKASTRALRPYLVMPPTRLSQEKP